MYTQMGVQNIESQQHTSMYTTTLSDRERVRALYVHTHTHTHKEMNVSKECTSKEDSLRSVRKSSQTWC
jgi:hypothetical protein